MTVHSGPTSREPFAYFDPDGSSVRMSQPSLIEGLDPSWREPLPTWPRSGTWDLGAAYALPTSAHPTGGNGSSSCASATETMYSLGGVRTDEHRPQGEVLLPRAAQFGQYAAAVNRWAAILGRPAPDPTIPGRNNGRRLNPRFVEWMMGAADGWVTGVPDLTISQQLKALGNGVITLQAVHALHLMLGGR